MRDPKTGIDVNATSLLKRYDQLKSERKNWESLWEEIADYVMPHKADFITQDRTRGDRARTRKVFDSTGFHANHLLAAHIHGALTNPATDWFDMRFRNDLSEETAIEWLEDSSRRMMDAFRESNFTTAISECYQDLVAFGTTVLNVSTIGELTDTQLVFRPVHLEGVQIAEDYNGRVDTVFEERRLTARQAIQRWPDLDQPIVARHYEKDPDHRVRFIHALMPVDEANATKGDNPDERPFVGIWLNAEDKLEVERGFFWELPNMVVRWSKVTHDVYGFGPGLMARPEILSLNEAKRLELAAWEKMIDPPLLAQDGGVFGDVHLEAGGVTVVRETASLAPLTQMTDWQATQVKAEETRAAIRAIYMIDQLHIPESPNMTATEVQVRYELIQRALGPTMGRLQAELLNPLIERVFGIMLRTGQLAPRPDSMQAEEDSPNIDIEYVGPLARAQKLEDADAVQRLMTFVIQLAQVDPGVLDVLDMAKATRMLGERFGVPADLMRSNEEVGDIQAARAQAQQQQAQMEQMQQMSQIAGDVAQARTQPGGPPVQ